MMMARGRSRGDGEPMMTMEMDEEMDAAEAEMAEDGGAEAFDLPPPLISRPSMSVTQGSTGIKYILPHRTSIPSGASLPPPSPPDASHAALPWHHVSAFRSGSSAAKIRV